MSDETEVVDLRPSNGRAVPLAKPPKPDEAPIMPDRLEWVALPREYPGFKILLWRNYEQAVWKDVMADSPKQPDVSEIEDEEERTAALEEWEAERDAAITRRIEALGLIFREHNHWRNRKGVEYPPTDTRAFWDAIPQEVAVILLKMADLSTYELPNSLTLTRRR